MPIGNIGRRLLRRRRYGGSGRDGASSLCGISGLRSEGRASADDPVVARSRAVVVEHFVADLPHGPVEWTPFPVGYPGKSANFGGFVPVEAADGECSVRHGPYLSPEGRFSAEGGLEKHPLESPGGE